MGTTEASTENTIANVLLSTGETIKTHTKSKSTYVESASNVAIEMLCGNVDGSILPRFNTPSNTTTTTTTNNNGNNADVTVMTTNVIMANLVGPSATTISDQGRSGSISNKDAGHGLWLLCTITARYVSDCLHCICGMWGTD